MGKKYTLGMTLAQSHDFSIALVDENGEVIYVGEEERFSRIKHNATLKISLHALEYFLKTYNIQPDEIKRIAVASSNNKYGRITEMLKEVKSIGICTKEVKLLDHHYAHAAASFFTSGLKEAAVLSVDGIGDECSWAIFYAKNGKIKRMDYQRAPHSIGYIYLLFTIWLGFGGFGNEGKTMGLSTYGEPKYTDIILNKIVNFDYKSKRIRMRDAFVTQFHSIKPLCNIFGPARKKKELITDYHKDVASSIQHVTQTILQAMIHYCIELTGCPSVCFTGGVALNCVANSILAKEYNVKSLFVSPISSDLGNSVGAALYFHNMESRGIQSGPKVYLGKQISNEEILKVAQRYNLKYRQVDNACKEAARALADGKIIGWVQGRSEVGPRALGNRSILGNVFSKNIRDKINIKVKFREEWRPFAPAVLKEDSKKIFEDYYVGNEFMTSVVIFKEEFAKKFPAVVHEDATGRVQIVSRESNSKFYELLNEIKLLTGYGIVLNTSFNLAGEPIVNSAEEILYDFLKSGLDEVYINDFKFEKGMLGSYKEISQKDCWNKIKNPYVFILNDLFRDSDDREFCEFIEEKWNGARFVVNGFIDIDKINWKQELDDTDCMLIKVALNDIYTRADTLLSIYEKVNEIAKIYLSCSKYDVVDIESIKHNLRMYVLAKQMGEKND